MTFLTTSLHRLRRQLTQLLATPTPSREYRRWRERFVRDRLRLTIWVAMVLGVIFISLNLALVVPAISQDAGEVMGLTPEQYRLYPIFFVGQQLGLLLNWALLRRTALARLQWHFLGLGFAAILIPQFVHLAVGETTIDLGAWILFFMLQAVLIPVRWRWHLISQVSLLMVLILSFGVLQFGLLGIPEELQQSVFIFHLVALGCVFFVADLGIYLYERLLMREFELRQQLELFLHAVSHDLRNPVTGALMLLQNLPVQAGKVTLEQTVVDQMIAGHQRQLQLINSLLEAHSQDVGRVVLHREAIALRQLVDSTILDLQPTLHQMQGTTQVLIAADLPLAMVDPLQMRRVYDNLITNALQYNRPGLDITLSATQQGNYLYCTVSDNGQGISPPDAEDTPSISLKHRIFDRYSRGINHRQPLHLGLGLYICRQIIEAHGGQIGVDSKSDQGTTFWFTLPLAELKSTTSSQ